MFLFKDHLNGTQRCIHFWVFTTALAGKKNKTKHGPMMKWHSCVCFWVIVWTTTSTPQAWVDSELPPCDQSNLSKQMEASLAHYRVRLDDSRSFDSPLSRQLPFLMDRVGFHKSRNRERSTCLKVTPVGGIKINNVQVCYSLSGECLNDAKLTHTK